MVNGHERYLFGRVCGCEIQSYDIKYGGGRTSGHQQDYNRAFSHDVTAAILVFQNNETAAMLVYQENPLGV